MKVGISSFFSLYSYVDHILSNNVHALTFCNIIELNKILN